jgi:hypothetical protein
MVEDASARRLNRGTLKDGVGEVKAAARKGASEPHDAACVRFSPVRRGPYKMALPPRATQLVARTERAQRRGISFFSCASFARGWEIGGLGERSLRRAAGIVFATRRRVTRGWRYSAPSPSLPPPQASSARAGSTSPTDAPAPPPPPRARPASRTAAAPACSRSSTAPAPNPTAPTLSPRSQLASARGPTVDGSRARFGVPRRLGRSFHAGLRVETMERAK